MTKSKFQNFHRTSLVQSSRPEILVCWSYCFFPSWLLTLAILAWMLLLLVVLPGAKEKRRGVERCCLTPLTRASSSSWASHHWYLFFCPNACCFFSLLLPSCYPSDKSRGGQHLLVLALLQGDKEKKREGRGEAAISAFLMFHWIKQRGGVAAAWRQRERKCPIC